MKAAFIIIGIMMILSGAYMMAYSVPGLIACRYLMYVINQHPSEDVYTELFSKYVKDAVDKRVHLTDLGIEIIKSHKSFENFYKLRLLKGEVM